MSVFALIGKTRFSLLKNLDFLFNANTLNISSSWTITLVVIKALHRNYSNMIAKQILGWAWLNKWVMFWLPNLTRRIFFFWQSAFFDLEFVIYVNRLRRRWIHFYFHHCQWFTTKRLNDGSITLSNSSRVYTSSSSAFQIHMTNHNKCY